MTSNPTTTNLAAAKDAYQASLNALDAAHDQQVAILAVQPVDWAAYDAANAATTELRMTADAAESLYETAILNNSTVNALINRLESDTNSMVDCTKSLDITAKKLKDLAQAADDVTSVLKVIAKFV